MSSSRCEFEPVRVRIGASSNQCRPQKPRLRHIMVGKSPLVARLVWIGGIGQLQGSAGLELRCGEKSLPFRASKTVVGRVERVVNGLKHWLSVVCELFSS